MKLHRLVARDLVVARSGKTVLEGVNLALRDGVLLGVVGPNGAGKSSLLACLTGELRPAAGEVLLDGLPVHAQAARDRAKAIAVVPQAMLPAFPVTVEGFVGLARYVHERPLLGPTQADRMAVQQSMERLGLAALVRNTVDCLSGGEFRRVLIAQAMAQAAPILLFDEPVQQLDVRHQLEVMEFVRSWIRRGANSGLVVLHELGLASRYCDEILLLGQGRMLARGRPEDVLTRDNIQAAYGIDCRIERCPATGAVVVLPIAPM